MRHFNFFSMWTLSLAILIAPGSVWGWGVLREVDTELSSSFLSSLVLRGDNIRYCLRIHTDRQQAFPEKALDLEIRSVIRQWLLPVLQAKVIEKMPEVLKTSCRNSQLIIDIGPDTQKTGIGGVWNMFSSERKFYHRISVYSDFETLTGLIQSWSFTMGEKDAALVIRRIESAKGPIDPYRFPQSVGLWRYLPFHHSTYALLLHEMGHAFGLCDSSKQYFSTACVAGVGSEQVVKTVMSDMSSLSLTQDDKDGIVEIFRRLR